MFETQQAPAFQSPIQSPTHAPTINDDSGKRQEVLRQCKRLFDNEPDWVSFYREVLGISGVVRRHYPDAHSLTEFEKSEEYLDIQIMLAKLRENGRTQVTDQEPTRVITVRMPKSLHESLRVEAHERHTSMNKLCISKLVQMIDEGLVPNEV
jgi:predicted HicB family RNase H-like nuclease